MNAELREWMAPTIAAVQPWCDEQVVAAGTFQGAGGWSSGISNGLLFGGLFNRPPKHVRERTGGLPDTVILAIGMTKVFVFAYGTKGLRLEVGPPVRVWKRDDLVVRSASRLVASKLTIDVISTGDHHELESTSMTGRLGKITKAIFALLDSGSRQLPARRAARPRTRPAKPDPRRERMGELADELEAELKRIGVWMPEPPGEQTVVDGGAFGMNSVAFETWLQVVLVARLREIAAGELEIPRSSSIGTFAIREFGGVGPDRRRLMDLIHQVDRLANRS